MSGTAFAANGEVADYFRQMYGFTRTQWQEDLARLQSVQPQVAQWEARSGARTADEKATSDARGAFIDFCHASTISVRNAEPAAPQNAAPPPQ